MPAPAPAVNLENAILDYVAGEGCEAVAARHRISMGRVKSALIDRGLWRDRAAAEAARIKRTSARLLAKSDLPPAEEIAARYLAGESSNALAKAYGVSRTAIDYRLEQAGVERRTMADANRLMAAARTPEENMQLASAAHKASRGRVRSMEERMKTAITRERLGTHISEHELQLVADLRKRGLVATPQKAVGPYNVDIATESIAVEVFGGGWHAYGAHRRRSPERLRYLLTEGWNLVIVWADANRWPVGPGAGEYIAAFAKVARRDPSIRGQYRVIWGDGKEFSADGLDVDNLAVKPTRGGREGTRARDENAGQ